MFVKLHYWGCSGDRGPHVCQPCFMSFLEDSNPVFVGKDWKQPRSFGRNSWFPGRHETQRRWEYVARCITVWPLANHIIIWATKFVIIAAGPLANYASPPQTYSNCSASSFNPSPPSAATVHNITSRTAWVFRPLVLICDSDVALGVTKVHLKEKGLAAVSSKKSRRKRHLFLRSVDNKLAAYWGCIGSVLGLHSAFWLLTLSFH